ncbi:TetR/AcrR family transcriptional regulator [Nonomuraea sp. NPDC050536]|uniref:TetR/AcrR family transcriptional regulator n=1 Tax=Nonomuraea sp. NPDC050536 TaxID=3364366 RepID=UPI0037C5BBE3
MSLRERKKAKTRVLIQREALRLFRDQGFAATTVEQIAEAAEVAPSTVFRYFRTKEDLVVMDDFPPFVDALTAAPADAGPIEAVRLALREVNAQRTPEERAAGLEIERLVFTVPELWAANLDNITQALASLRDLLATRAGRPTDDPEIRNIAGAIAGVVMAVWFDWVRDPDFDGPAELDRALASLDSGFTL